MSPTTPPVSGAHSRETPRIVALTLLTYGALLRLCPRGFREAFGVEMTQVFRQTLWDAWEARGAWGVAREWTRALADLLVGALAEHVDDFARSVGMMRGNRMIVRLRSSAILVFCAYIAFVLAGMGFQKVTEEAVKSSVPTAHPLVALSYDVVVVGSVVALLAVLAGGLPIAFAALRQAVSQRRWGIVALFAVPSISLAIWLAWTAIILNVIAPRNANVTVTDPRLSVLLSWAILFVLAAIASVAAVSVAVSRSDVRPELYRFALGPEVVLTLAMAAMVAGVVMWGIQMQAVAPAYLTGLQGPGGALGPAYLDIILQVAVMVVATALAVAGVARGATTRRQVA